MPNWYTTRERVRQALGFAAADRTDLNAAIDRLIEDVSREADTHCGTHFYVRNATRLFTYVRDRRYSDAMLLLHTELVSVTSLKTDTAGDFTYATTWNPATDYWLHPEDAPYQSPPAPYWAISRVPSGDYGWLTSLRGIQIVGKWGHYEVLERSTATVGVGGITNSATSLPLNTPTAIETGMTLLIDSEQLFVSSGGVTPATVVRGVNGTTAAAHTANTVIDVYTYPLVSEAVLTQCHRNFEAHLGRPNRSESEAVARAYARLDRDVRGKLDLMRYRGP